jgi:hypothetical protein
MRIGYTIGRNRGDTDVVLFRLAQDLIARGLRPVGTIQINTENDDTSPCDMDIKVLPDGMTLRISQSLGPAAKGCRLDPGALEMAVGLVQAELSGGADILIVNKFGKHEAAGRGFRPIVAEALARGIPVLTGVNRLNMGAFLKFTDGIGTELPLHASSLERWVLENMSRKSLTRQAS